MLSSPYIQVLQLTKEANRPMERNISSSKLGGMVNGSKSASAASSSSSAAVNFIPINALEACDDNLCFNGGFCDPLSQKCRCRGHFIGKPSNLLFFLTENVFENGTYFADDT